ncbi:Sensor histidine kinase DcuS [Austwickia sp. TVS 96-490-7B]|nr:Sensor histidine kinase DcuS [Austwickia sp. TVS 96-490-7B]
MPLRPAPAQSLASRVFVAQLAVMMAVVVVGTIGAAVQARRAVAAKAASTTLAVARTVATDPQVAVALRGPDPARALQSHVEEVRRRNDVSFVVVMSPAGQRYTHPISEKIGQIYVGSLGAAPNGGEETETRAGTMGVSLRSVVPIRERPDGPVMGLVAVGIPVEHIEGEVASWMPTVLAAGVAAALVTWVVGTIGARRVARATHGMTVPELRGLYDCYDAALHAMREGLVLIGEDGQVRVVNDEARRLLGVNGTLTGAPSASLGLPADLVAAVSAGTALSDRAVVAGSRIVVASVAPTGGGGSGAVITLRDRTELEEVAGELASTRTLMDALRAQSHEAGNRLHTVVSLVEMGQPDEAVAFATEEAARGQRLTDEVMSASGEPAVTALLLAKSNDAARRGVSLDLDPDSWLPAGIAPAPELVTIVGNLVDNAIEAAARSAAARVGVAMYVENHQAVIEVTDSGPGLPTDADAFAPGWTTKPDDGRPHGLGLALVREAAARLGGTVQVADDDSSCLVARFPAGGTSG